ncbi:MAG: pilus assembly protein CpaD [Hyphomicrobiales bacterium]|nr:pilus assembly protein CpaD [Hyphomicrobiales bacterium]
MPRTPALTRMLAMLLLACPLAACGGVDRVITNSAPPDDYEKRHPIELRQDVYKVDLFVNGSLDARSKGQLAEFAQTWRRLGGGQMRLLLPTGTFNEAANTHALDSIRHELLQNGMRGAISVGSYQVADPRLASPLQLSFVGLKAKVATRCGEWPEDMGSGSTLQGWGNHTYWNHGCSYQNMLATQVADPRDLADKQAEGPKDTEMRTRAIGNVRKGTDPGTAWTTKNSSIGAVGN